MVLFLAKGNIWASSQRTSDPIPLLFTVYMIHLKRSDRDHLPRGE